MFRPFLETVCVDLTLDFKLSTQVHFAKKYKPVAHLFNYVTVYFNGKKTVFAVASITENLLDRSSSLVKLRAFLELSKL